MYSYRRLQYALIYHAPVRASNPVADISDHRARSHDHISGIHVPELVRTIEGVGTDQWDLREFGERWCSYQQLWCTQDNCMPVRASKPTDSISGDRVRSALSALMPLILSPAVEWAYALVSSAVADSNRQRAAESVCVSGFRKHR